MRLRQAQAEACGYRYRLRSDTIGSFPRTGEGEHDSHGRGQDVSEKPAAALRETHGLAVSGSVPARLASSEGSEGEDRPGRAAAGILVCTRRDAVDRGEDRGDAAL